MANEPPSGRHSAAAQRPRRARRRLWLLAAAGVVIAIVATTGGVMMRKAEHHPATANAATTAPPSPSTTPAPAPAPVTPTAAAPLELTASFTELEQTIGGLVGLTVTPLGGGPIMTFGTLSTGPAWSTSKVPLVMAALRDQAEPAITSEMTAAIERSDNDAAEAIWAGLGDPATAAEKVGHVLKDFGDQTAVESKRTRAEYTAFGQTVWSLADQVRFLSRAACDHAMDPVLNLMGQVEGGQRWGIGTIADARFKGGWGPSPEGNYLVRQFGLISTGQGIAAVAVAAQPASGSFGAGTAALDDVAAWLTKNLPQLPGSQCP